MSKENHKTIVFFEKSYYKEIIMDKEKFKSCVHSDKHLLAKLGVGYRF